MQTHEDGGKRHNGDLVQMDLAHGCKRGKGRRVEEEIMESGDVGSWPTTPRLIISLSVRIVPYTYICAYLHLKKDEPHAC